MMLDVFQFINLFLIVFTAVLFYRNRIWEEKPIFIALLGAIILCFLLTLLI